MSQLFFPIFAISTSFFIGSVTHAETNNFSVATTSFKDRGTIPAVYTCEGQDLSPSISWQGASNRTKTFALICADPDAPTGTWYHWVMYNIPSKVTYLPEGASAPSGALFGKNSWGRTQYNGPCPPKSTIHSYIFTIYALDTYLNLPEGASASQLQTAMQGHILGTGSMMAVFGQ